MDQPGFVDLKTGLAVPKLPDRAAQTFGPGVGGRTITQDTALYRVTVEGKEAHRGTRLLPIMISKWN